MRERLFQLEGKIRKLGGTVDSDAGKHSTSVIKMIENKDFRLEQYAAQLEEKKEQLQEAVRELEQKNEQMSLWMATLRLYSEIFENEPSVMIGVNLDGKVILYNKTAPSHLGESLKNALHQPVESVDFTGFDPATSRLVRDALAHRRQAQNLVRVQGRRITTSVYPMGFGSQLTGALIRISATPDK